jgi:nucleoside-diphosphate-sugar epimerase
MTRVFVTGGGGFIGSHLVESQLGRGYQVRTIDLNVERLAHVAHHPRLEIVAGDITNSAFVERLLEGIDVVYHLASAHLDVTLAERRYRQVNVEATHNLLRAAHQAGVRRFVHCSSNGVLGETAVLPANESTPCHPTNIYEQTKLEGEQRALKFSQETGLPVVVVVRPAWVYGPRCPRTQKLFRTISRRRFVMFGRGDTLRHPVYVSDAVLGLELAAEADSAVGQIYFIAGEEPVTIANLVQMIADVLDVPAPSVCLPLSLGRLAGYGVQLAYKPLGWQPPFSRRTIDFFIKNNAYDISKARRELGFEPRVDLWTGLSLTRHWLNESQESQNRLWMMS